MVTTLAQFPAPFDGAAPLYDETFTQTSIGRAQRDAVWRHFGRAFTSGQRVLDIGCGTGVDACFLAQRGVRVVACDSSSQMLAVADRRISEQRLQKMVQSAFLPAEAIGSLRTDELFDGAISNFGALNCVEDAAHFAAGLALLLKPGARALLVWIGPSCLWEIIWYLGRRNARKAFRRFHRDGFSANVAGGPPFRVSYPKIRSLAAAFQPEFRLRSIRGIGVAVPPSYVESWAANHPYLMHSFSFADRALTRIPGIRALADHVLLEFERTQASLRASTERSR